MNIKWKDALGLSALIMGFILSGMSLTHKMTSPSQTEATTNEKEIHKPFISQHLVAKKKRKKENHSKTNRSPQSEPTKEDIASLLNCYKTEKCSFPSNDPREYKLAVGQAIKKQLRDATTIIQKGDLSSAKDWTYWAMESLKVPDGHVKEAALDLISTQDPAPEIFETLMSEVISYHDPHLISQAMNELQKYMTPKYEQQIYTQLSKTLRTGSLLVKREVAQNIVPFINDRSLPYFQESLKSMSPQSNVHTVLYKVIKDFKNQKTGA